MGRESCIEGTTGNFLIVRQCFVDLFDGDHAHAAVLYCMEFLANGQIESMEMREEIGDAWFEASILKLADKLVGLYGKNTIMKCLDGLNKFGLLEIEKTGLGNVNRYLLNYKKVNDLLRRKVVLKIPKVNFAESKIGPVESTPESSAESTPESKIGPVYKEEEFRIQNSEEDYTSPEQLAKIFLSKYKQCRGTHLDSQRQDRRRILDWLSEQSESPDRILAALDRFLLDEYWRGKKFPLAGFREQFQKYLDLIPAPRSPDAPRASPSSPVPPDTPQADLLALWNRLVPAAPCAVDSYTPRKEMALCMAETDFTVEKFTEACTVAQQIHALKGAAAGWLDLRWALVRNEGKPPGWYRLLKDMRWMAETPKVATGGIAKNEVQLERERLDAIAAQKAAAKAARVQEVRV